jgi:hypothetical protein
MRVADPAWRNPLSGAHAQSTGGRWNPPDSFAVIYLNHSLGVARAQVLGKLEARGIRPEDLDPRQAPVLVQVDVPDDRYVDAVTEDGLKSLGLPASYPLDASGNVVPHRVCRPVGQRARSAGEEGIACRSAAPASPPGGEELAYFGARALRQADTSLFADWFWSDH